MLLADTHTHTKFSSDSKAEPKEMLTAAMAAGLSALCFTDHMDLDFPGDDSLFVFDTKEYFKEFLPLKEQNNTDKTNPRPNAVCWTISPFFKSRKVAFGATDETEVNSAFLLTGMCACEV